MLALCFLLGLLVACSAEECDIAEVDTFHDCIQAPLTPANGQALQDAKLGCFEKSGCKALSAELKENWVKEQNCRDKLFAGKQVPIFTKCMLKAASDKMTPPAFLKQFQGMSYNPNCEIETECEYVLDQFCGSDQEKIKGVRSCMNAIQQGATTQANTLIGGCFSKMSPACQSFQMNARPEFCKCANAAFADDVSWVGQWDECKVGKLMKPPVASPVFLAKKPESVHLEGGDPTGLRLNTVRRWKFN